MHKRSHYNSFIALLVCSVLSAAFSLAPLASAETLTVTYPYYGFVEDSENPWETAYSALDETGTADYSDAYFFEPSPGDHPELRAVSYALALAGFENQADGYPASSPNEKLYSLLSRMGFSDMDSRDTSSDPAGHSFGVTIAEKTLPSGQPLVVVAPRNYNYMTEWLSNFNVGTSGDHAGFSEASGLLVSRLESYLSSRSLENYKLWIVGYSRGGAVVDLAGKAINERLSDFSLDSNDLYIYTFGAPRASVTAPAYSNIHDVKDGNDLILGYLFPEAWGFSNTGVYEEIHPADLKITTSVVDITDLADLTRALELLTENTGLTRDVATENGRDFMDAWLNFVTENGLTREYFDSEIKPPLSAIMQAYQLRTLDKQGDFTDFLTSTESGIPAMFAGNAFADLLTGNYPGNDLYTRLDNFPPYQDIVKILKGTATSADIDDLVSYLPTYLGEYSDYEYKLGVAPTITEEEFGIIKTNLPSLIRALAPIITADAAYTQATYGESSSLYYTYSLAANAEKLVYGHIPESIMPLLKSLIPDPVIPLAPNTGRP
ncbi:hypothetical protein IJH89_00975 [Candidatus Saccharibacteria bacterium]|nr:hypothetical protein [Candidatus Saccharibacteria bacterium]